MMADHMLTTVDNPFDPFTQYDQWFTWDRQAGYNTPGYLARIARVSDELSDADIELAVEAAMDEIVSENILGVHTKVSAPDSVV